MLKEHNLTAAAIHQAEKALRTGDRSVLPRLTATINNSRWPNTLRANLADHLGGRKFKMLGL